MKNVAFYTLGCKLNFSETSTIARMFEDKGYVKVDFEDNPDIFVINTCSVTDNADKKCRKIVRDAKRISPHAFVTIIGCYAQLKPKEISEIPGVNAVLGASEKFKLFDYLGDFEPSEQTIVENKEIKEATRFNASHSYGDRTRSFLKVQDGCNYGCSFCTIPLARGKSRSSTIKEIALEAEKIAATEVREIVLTGVNIGDFGIVDSRRTESFLELIKVLDTIEGIDRFRISSIEPNLLSNEIIEFVGQSKRFAPHFHIPLQSGSDVILKSMNRRYLSDLYRGKVALINKVIQDACIGVDVIVGFPGETDAEFQKSFDFLNELNISYLHVFPYSQRPNTRAVELPGHVESKVKQERALVLRSLSEKKRRVFNTTQIGKTKDVLFEHDINNGFIEGWTENYVRVRYPFEEGLSNSLLQMKLRDFNEEGIVNVESELPVA